ncbi:hypothetical protein SAMN05444008_101384 [Cnuella takakiae]|uniref:Uncharacterized protein n=1 Tax=Cnuella takakiae TaxID=1302690 RepID=A0A1M4TCQ4_9BACT|nr:hypothetical protein SAMN05444008_101384 [Cnuella takakiae]
MVCPLVQGKTAVDVKYFFLPDILTKKRMAADFTVQPFEKAHVSLRLKITKTFFI